MGKVKGHADFVIIANLALVQNNSKETKLDLDNQEIFKLYKYYLAKLILFMEVILIFVLFAKSH